MATVSIDRESGGCTPCEFDYGAPGIGLVLCMILTGLTPEEMAREIVQGNRQGNEIEVAK